VNNEFIDNIAYTVYNDKYFNELYKKSIQLYTNKILGENHSENLSEKELNDIFRFTDLLSLSTSGFCRSRSYSLLSLLYPIYKDNNLFKKYMHSLISKLGLFALEETLLKTQETDLPLERLFEKEIKKEIQKVPNSKYFFTDIQFKIFSKLKEKNNFSFSGPTSMGKSFLIKQYVKSIVHESKNILILVPTRALIQQTLIDIRQELRSVNDRFKLYTNSNLTEIEIEDDISYILIYTPERLMSFLSQNNNLILDIAFIDEAHKLTANDDRSITEFSAIQNLLYKNENINLYFSSPNISNPEVYLREFQKDTINSIKIEESPVGQNLYFVDFNEQKISYVLDSEFLELKNDLLKYNSEFDFIKQNGENEKSNLIYCSSPDKAISAANNLYDLINSEIKDDEIESAINKIKEYIHEKYYLVKLLKKGIGYHFGQMPQIVRNIIEELYEKDKLKYLISTATLLEGVNMPTKNIFIFKDDKFNYKIESGFDFENTSAKVNFWNLVGRAGRYTKELSGNIFCIESENYTDRKWKREIFDKKDLYVDLTVFNKVHNESEKIEEFILDGWDITKGNELYRNIGNLLCIDILKESNVYTSPLLNNQKIKNKIELINKAKEKAERVKDVPIDILASNYSIDLDIQKSLYLTTFLNIEEIKFNAPDYNECEFYLHKFAKDYKWEEQEKNLLGKYYDDEDNNRKLKFLAYLMNSWMYGTPIKKIIMGSIDFKRIMNGAYLDEQKYVMINNSQRKVSPVYLFKSGIPLKKENTEELILFNPDDIEHINVEINNILELIEKELRFRLEKYFNHYYQIVDYLRNENQKIGQNWAIYLEYGTRDMKEVELQNYGFSRYSANKLVKEYLEYLNFNDDEKFLGFHSNLVYVLDENSIEYDEVTKLITLK
jgi:replicative superfamily II helicase